jgi:hypothetical protein
LHFFGTLHFVFIYTFFGRCWDFFNGIALAPIDLKSYPRRLQLPVFTLVGIAISSIVIGIMVQIPLSSTFHFGLYHPVGILANNLLLPIGVSLFFYGLIVEKTWINLFLSSKPMQQISKIYY